MILRRQNTPVKAAQFKEELDKRDHKIAELMSDNRLLRQELQALREGIFGRKTERILPGQLGLFGNGESLPEAPERKPKEVKPKSKPKGHGRSQFAAHLQREVVNLELPEDQRQCSCCQKPLQVIGEEVTERGHIVPAKVVVRRYVRKKYACPDGHELRTAEVPEGVVRKAKYEESVYAHLVASKYCDHLPLNRLEGIFKRAGLHLPKQTMWDMLVKVDELVAQPVIEQMRREILEAEALHSDDTTIWVQTEGQKGSKQGHIWTWRTPRALAASDPPCRTLVQFTMGRTRAGPKQLLGNWKGTLVVDGISTYNEVIDQNGIDRAGCWSHARRGFVKALKRGSRDAALILAPMHRLFWIERAMLQRAKARGMARDEVLALRERVRDHRSRRVQKLIFELAFDIQEKPTTSPDSKLGKAIGYLLNQAAPLQHCLGDPRIPIHNNDAERDLRHVALGRKNYMIFASPKGGEVAARLYTLMLSAKHAGLDPEAYVRGILSAVNVTQAKDIATLTPWAWEKTHPEHRI